MGSEKPPFQATSLFSFLKITDAVSAAVSFPLLSGRRWQQ
jgi:hypothetical protein